MIHRYLAFGALVVALVLGLGAMSGILGQEPTAGAEGWSAPRTGWGDPDLQGIWSPGYTLTPLERPDEFAGVSF